MADFPAAAVDRLGDYNGARYDAQTNPFGFAIGGHRVNFPQALNDTASVAAYVAVTAQEVKDAGAAVVERLAQAQAARDEARLWATAPENQAVAGGLFSAFHYARKAAASALAAAGFDPALFVKRDGSQAMTARLDLAASTTGAASLRVPHGATPTAPVNGDLWTTTSGLLVRVNGATRTFHDSVNMPGATDAEADAGTGTTLRAWTVARVWRAARAALADALALKFDKAGGAIGGAISVAGTISTTAEAYFAGMVRSGVGGVTSVAQLQPGHATRSGYLELLGPDGTREGFIGATAAGSGKGIPLNASNGNWYEFQGVRPKHGATDLALVSDLAFSNISGVAAFAQLPIAPHVQGGVGSVCAAVNVPGPTSALPIGTSQAGSQLGDPVNKAARYFTGSWRVVGFNAFNGSDAIHNWQRFA